MPTFYAGIFDVGLQGSRDPYGPNKFCIKHLFNKGKQ